MTSLQPPPWVTEAEAHEYGVAFCCLFQNRAHFDSWKATGDIRRPSTIRRQAQLDADPVVAQKAHLQRTVRTLKDRIRDASQKLTQAQQALDSNQFGSWYARDDIARQQTRLAEARAALPAAETTLALFVQMHPMEEIT